jgi:hypothetical protein
MTAIRKAIRQVDRPQLADQRPILGPEAVIQRDESGTVDIRQPRPPIRDRPVLGVAIEPTVIATRLLR